MTTREDLLVAAGPSVAPAGGTAGRTGNAQVAVYLGYAAPRGHALTGRELYLPKSWTSDEDRCAAAGIPATAEFATKPQLAKQMIKTGS